MPNVVRWANTQPSEALPGLTRRTLGETSDVMIVEFRAKAGVKIPPHAHPNQQVGYVVGGEVEITIDGTATACRPGDSYAIPGGMEHSAYFPVESTVVECFSPPREDYR